MFFNGLKSVKLCKSLAKNKSDFFNLVGDKLILKFFRKTDKANEQYKNNRYLSNRIDSIYI